jgi:hypothetical protein
MQVTVHLLLHLMNSGSVIARTPVQTADPE